MIICGGNTYGLILICMIGDGESLMRDIVKALAEDNRVGTNPIQPYAFSQKRNVSVLQKVCPQFLDLTGVSSYINIIDPPLIPL